MDSAQLAARDRAVEAGDDQARVSADLGQLGFGGGQPRRAGQLQAVRLGDDQPRVARVVDLEDVRAGPSPGGSRPTPVTEANQQQLVLQAGKRELAVVVEAERVLVELLDRRGEADGRVGLGAEAALARRLGGDHQRTGDITAVAGKQLEGLVDGEPRLGGHRLQRPPLRQQAAAERRRVERL